MSTYEEHQRWLDRKVADLYAQLIAFMVEREGYTDVKTGRVQKFTLPEHQSRYEIGQEVGFSKMMMDAINKGG